MPDPDDFTLYHYDPSPDATRHPLERLRAGDRACLVRRQVPGDGEWQVGDPVVTTVVQVGLPVRPVPPTRWARFKSWVTRRPLTMPDYTIRFDGVDDNPGPVC